MQDWGLVCGDGWSLFEAMVVCRELGLGYAQYAIQTDFFGGNQTSLALSGVQCQGGERSLLECFHDRYGEINCPGKSENIASVVCASGDYRFVLPFFFNASAQLKGGKYHSRALLPLETKYVFFTITCIIPLQRMIISQLIK